MTYQQLLDEKFLACTSLPIDELAHTVSHDRFKKYKLKYNIKNFHEKLIPHQMEEFSEPLFLYMIFQLKIHEGNKNNLLGYFITRRQSLIFQEELVVSLKELLSGGKLDIVITNLPKPHIIKNKEVKDILFNSAIKSLFNEIEKLGLNSFPITHEEAVEAINNHTDVEWIRDWMESSGYIDPDYESFTLNNFNNYIHNIIKSDIVGGQSKMRDNLISEYASDHPEEVLPDIEGIDRILLRIREEKSKKGRKQETEVLKFLAYTLSCLKRLDRYLEDQKFDTINEVPITNEDCRFIHDVMAFFGLIKDYTTHTKYLKSLEKRIRKMLKDLNDPYGMEDMYEKLKLLKLSLNSQK